MSDSAPSEARRPLNAFFILAFGLFAIGGFFAMRIYPGMNDVPFDFVPIVENKKFDNGFPLRQSFTGFEPVDAVLRFLVAAFLPGAAGFTWALWLQQMHFMLNFFPVLCIINVEGNRKRNVGKALRYTAVWAFFYQTVAGALFVPLWFLAHIYASSNDKHFSAGREVSLSSAKGLLVASMLVYLLPTIAMYVPWSNVDFHQGVIASWQMIPVVLNLAVLMFSSAFASISKPEAAAAKGNDVKILKLLYLISGAVSGIVHISVLYYCLTSANPQRALLSIFIPDFATWKEDASLGLLWIFQVDALAMFGSGIAWAWVQFLDIWRLTHDPSVVQPVVLSAIGMGCATALLGPGATMALVAYWRENQLVEIEEGGEGGVGGPLKIKAM